MSITYYSPLIHYPKPALVNRSVPKNKIYKQRKVDAKLRQYFIEEIDEIVWQYKLATETIDLSGTEIQVFTIKLSKSEPHLDIFRCIDEVIHFPIFFELVFDGQIKVMSAYKALEEETSKKYSIGSYFESSWFPINSTRSPMPFAQDLTDLYHQLLENLSPVKRRPKEDLSMLVNRIELINKKEGEIKKIARKLKGERQFNRKILINQQIRALTTELETLKNPNLD